MKSLWIKEPVIYDGAQLVSHFAYFNYKVLGDSILAWKGPCNIPRGKMIDGEDILAGEEIRGGEMVHFVVEIFDPKLFTAVTLQRLMAAMAYEVIREQGGNMDLINRIHRDGDDLFLGEKKLSISIATVSPVSMLIHYAVNVTNAETPVETCCLKDLDVNAEVFAEKYISRFVEEVESIRQATQKVKWVQ